MLSLVASSDSSRSAYYAPVSDLTELEELIISGELAAVSQIAERFDVSVIYFDGGTLVVDDYSDRNGKDRVHRLIRALKAESIDVKRVRVCKSEELNRYLRDKVHSVSKVDVEINTHESLMMFSKLMERAVELNSEDVYIHLSESAGTAFAQFKVEGELHSETFPLKDYLFGKSMCQAVYDGKDGIGKTSGFFDDVTTPQEREIEHVMYDNRGNLAGKLEIRFTKTTTSRAGELLVNMRIQKGVRRLNELGLPDAVAAVIKRKASKTKGCILTAGKTGSGKSTTNFAVLLDMPRTKSIQTFEDPIEIPKPAEYINIIQNSLDKKLGVREQLKAILRMAPDGLFIQEVRDHETADFLFHVLKTGFFAIASVHANNAIGIVDRLIDLGVSEKELASPESLSLLIHQTLIKTLCPKCKLTVDECKDLFPFTYSKKVEAFEQLGMHIFEQLGSYVRHPKGCEHCKGAGETGRQLIIESIDVQDDDRQFILQRDMMGWREHLVSNKGFRTAAEQARELYAAGLIDVVRVAEITVG